MPLHLDLLISRDHHFHGFTLLPAEDKNPRCRLESVRVVGKVDCAGTYFKAVRRVGAITEAVAVAELELVITGRMYNHLYPYLGGPLARAVGEFSYLRSLSLVACKIGSSIDEQGLSLLPDCNLPHLTELYLRRCDEYTIQILRILVTPALVTLGIERSAGAGEEQGKREPVVLREPLPSLPCVKRIALWDLPTPADIWTILSSAPNVTHLGLSSNSPSLTLDHLLTRPTSECLTNVTHAILNFTLEEFLRGPMKVLRAMPSLQGLEVSGNDTKRLEELPENLGIGVMVRKRLEFEEVVVRLKEVAISGPTSSVVARTDRS